MPKRIDKTSRRRDEFRFGKHRYEHWYVDNQVYFITARCRGQSPAFATERAKEIFWDRFDHHSTEAGFFPWVVSLLDNHYHVLGYNRSGDGLRRMMQRLHGSVAKLVNDVLREAERASACPEGVKSFWRDGRDRDFFDGCIRDTRQCRLAYRYILTQCRRHGICHDPADYPHTRPILPLEPALRRAVELGAFMKDVPYPRYFGGRESGAR